MLSLPLRGPGFKRGFYQVSLRQEEFLEDRLIGAITGGPAPGETQVLMSLSKSRG